MNNKTKICCDVLIIGGSLEGCITALECARRGKKVLLAEKQGSLGGMATNGLSTYLPINIYDKPEAAQYAELILNRGNETEKGSTSLYHDQKLKLVLEQLLHTAGVMVLKHLYLNQIQRENRTLICSFCTKTDFLEITANSVYDATDTMTAAASLGWTWQQKRGHIDINVKFNMIPTQQLKKISTHLLEETCDILIGTILIPFCSRIHEQQFYVRQLTYYHHKHIGETIFSGFYAEITEANDFTLSNSIAGLRIFAYDFRNYIRKQYTGMEQADIIHTASLVNCYGLRVFEAETYSNLILLNNSTRNYSNWEAIVSGVEAPHHIC